MISEGWTFLFRRHLVVYFGLRKMNWNKMNQELNLQATSGER